MSWSTLFIGIILFIIGILNFIGFGLSLQCYATNDPNNLCMNKNSHNFIFVNLGLSALIFFIGGFYIMYFLQPSKPVSFRY